MLEKIQISSRTREEFIDITGSVQRVVGRSDVSSGVCFVYVPHTTAGLTINENADPSVASDILAALSRLVPRNDPAYKHGEGNSDSHLKAALLGTSLSVPVSNSTLMLGTWQGIFFCEFDGPRRRSVFVHVLSEQV